MLIADALSCEELGERVDVELRIRARARDRPNVDNQIYVHRQQQRDEVGDRPCRVANGEQRAAKPIAALACLFAMMVTVLPRGTHSMTKASDTSPLPPGSPHGGFTRSQHELSVLRPYRLDLTVSVLRRLAANVVDVFTTDRVYVRALHGTHGPVIARVAQTRAESLTVTIDGDADDHAPTLALVRRMLGVDRDLTRFNLAAATIPWLSPLAVRMHGVKPPRYASLWEAFVNVIAFQQLSLHAASAIVRRLVESFGPALDSGGVPLHMFPGPGDFLATDDRGLRAIGLSASKRATLRRAGEALVGGTLDLARLEECPSPAAAVLLQEIKGIGPWTATVILLRGLGRLDVFPMNDTSVARNLALVAGPGPLDIDRAVDALRPQQGMLYYHLLLARLEARGELAGASSVDAEFHR